MENEQYFHHETSTKGETGSVWNGKDASMLFSHHAIAHCSSHLAATAMRAASKQSSILQWFLSSTVVNISVHLEKYWPCKAGCFD